MKKRVVFKDRKDQKLSKIEEEVLHLLTKEYQTPKQVSIRRGTSSQATYKIINNLKKKGVLTRNYKRVAFSQGTIQPFQGIRVHALEFNIKIINKNYSYNKRVGKSNLEFLDGNTIKLCPNSLEVYGNKSFFGFDEQRAMSKAVSYYNRFFVRLESFLNIVILKRRIPNISLVRCEFSEVDNEVARDCGDKSSYIKLFAREDGKLWFSIDNSFNLYEMETHHKHTAKRDMFRVKKHIQDWRDNDPVTNSELMVLVKRCLEVNLETASGLNVVVDLLKPKEKVVEERVVKPNYVG